MSEENDTLQITNLCSAPVKAPITHHPGSSLQARQAMQNQKGSSVWLSAAAVLHKIETKIRLH